MSKCSIHASAPGKVVLSGEYAVLDGAPAICMAVNRRARVTIVSTGDNHNTVVAPGHHDEITRFRADAGDIEWIDNGEHFDLFEHIWRASGTHCAAGLALTLDTTGFVDAVHGRKTGIGSSAALSVALAHALHELEPRNNDPVAAAHRGHLAFQNGLGSGVDIATSAAGGLIEFTMQGRLTSVLQIPDGLECRLLWSGAPAKTGMKLEHYGSGGAGPSRAALVDAAQRMAEAWHSGSVATVLGEFCGYIRVLQEFSVDHDLGIFDAGHEKLVAAANARGLVYKPCGAGGGDIGVILADNVQIVDEFIAGELPATFQPMDLQFDTRGVQVAKDVE